MWSVLSTLLWNSSLAETEPPETCALYAASGHIEFIAGALGHIGTMDEETVDGSTRIHETET
jgi:hypothetical protein